MTKYFCDFCGKEMPCDELKLIVICDSRSDTKEYYDNEAESSLEKARMLECELENILNTHIFSKQVSFEKDPSEYNRGGLDAINNCFEEYQKRMQELRRVWNERWGEDNVAQKK